MKIDGIAYRSIWSDAERQVKIIDQTQLPFSVEIMALLDLAAAAEAIESMRVRGAPLIGVCAAYGVAMAMRVDASDASLQSSLARLLQTRPTAINLHWALQRMRERLMPLAPDQRAEAAWQLAERMADEDVAVNHAIGEHGCALIEQAWRDKGQPEVFHVLTHCNAGWIATVDWGTALAPIYLAHERGVPVHVWVDETRPRMQGAQLTAWELGAHGVAHDLVVDNAGGYLMQTGQVDLVLTGTDRVTRRGDVCNKIGTYLKALAAKDNAVPFWVALPSSTIDWSLDDGVRDIPIEDRGGDEVTQIRGWSEQHQALVSVRLCPAQTSASNPGFDVTPARLVSGLITERGCCLAQAEALAALFPERAA
jgi:methylthioribose-1-phosphate isomerase